MGSVPIAPGQVCKNYIQKQQSGWMVMILRHSHVQVHAFLQETSAVHTVNAVHS